MRLIFKIRGGEVVFSFGLICGFGHELAFLVLLDFLEVFSVLSHSHLGFFLWGSLGLDFDVWR